MRGVARAKGSLLRFMREEIPGVTSPMVYIAMMFSWFAWHVEDHDLHSLNYLHTGAGKTWYGVPRDAALAFEEVVRVHGYGGEVNPLITFATLAEKTTIMSPEVLIGSGIPCCRLVQNVGEFVVTFPGAYHSGFSHGFNCGEASNIATPGWLKVAKEAAVRRASTNCPPMVSHYQLLYALSLSSSLRSPTNILATPKSLRLKNKLRSVGETLIKETFVQSVMRDNNLQSTLLSDNSSCVVLPKNAPGNPLCPSFHLNYHSKVKPRIALGLCSGSTMEENSTFNLLIDGRMQANYLNGCARTEENSFSVYQRRKCFARTSTSESSEFNHSSSEKQHNEEFEIYKFQTRGYLDQGLLSCVTCGILSYACVAVIQPRESTVEFLMSASCNSFASQGVEVEKNYELENAASKKVLDSDVGYNLGDKEKTHSAVQLFDRNHGLLSNSKVENGASALDLLASAYGGSSESEEDAHQLSVCSNGNNMIHSHTRNLDKQSVCTSENAYFYDLPKEEGKVHENGSCQVGANDTCCSFSSLETSCKVLPQSSYTVSSFSPIWRNNSVEFVLEEKMRLLADSEQENISKELPTSLAISKETRTSSLIKPAGELLTPETFIGLGKTYDGDQSSMSLSDVTIRKMESDSFVHNYPGSFYIPAKTGNTVSTNLGNLDDSIKDPCIEVVQKASIGSSRMHVFCLEHAVEVEKRLHALGGVNIMLLCHPDYPKFVSEAKLLAKELGYHHQWKDVQYRDASKQDQEKIKRALEDEEAIPYNDDWTVKLGINLYYSVNLSKSPLFRKQLPYNEVIYKSFAQKSPVQMRSSKRMGGRQKKINFAGKWCGKVWMSNQVHPYLADLNLADDDNEVDHGCEPEINLENGMQEIQPGRRSSNNNATVRGKSGKRKNKNTPPTRLDNSNDAERSGYSIYEEDDELDADQRSEIDVNTENCSVATSSGRDSTNKNGACRRKNTKGRKFTIRPSVIKPAADAGFAQEGSVYFDEVQDTDQISEGDTELEDEKKAIPCVKNKIIKRKSGEKRNSSTRSSNWKSACARLYNSCDAGYAEEDSGCSRFADDMEEMEHRSECNTNQANKKQGAILCTRKKSNNSTRWKSGEKKNASTSCTRKFGDTRLHNPRDAAYAEENSGYGDDVQDTDQRSDGDTILENKKQETRLRRASKNKNDSGKRKSGKRREKTARKPLHTRLDSSSDAANAEEISGCEGYDINKRFEDGTDQENEKQGILSRGSLKNIDVLSRGRSSRKRKKAVRSSTRKPSHTGLDNSSDVICADADHETKQRSEDDTDLENGKQAKRPRRNPTNKNACVSRKPVKKRKRSTSTRRKKSARSGHDNSKGTGYAEDDLSAKTDPPCKRPHRQRLNSGETILAMDNEKNNKKRKAKEAPDSGVGKEERFTCNIDGCSMTFGTRHELVVHKRNICPERGCGKEVLLPQVSIAAPESTLR
ncbi:hypothetical protein HPP92_020224 [Vanilla planifolia]|uniref:JmjC domain-containing protein n=1 Tax=Vanilla planifolia TaxID=51239 RepID=A0A835UKK6_VANPL|nr:hypothetical protein HPP92_020224 [Vanilla planifolia]